MLLKEKMEVFYYGKKEKISFVCESFNYSSNRQRFFTFEKSDLTNYTKFVLGIEDFEIFEDAGYSGGRNVHNLIKEFNSNKPKISQL